MATDYHDITEALEEAGEWLQEAANRADAFAGECDGAYAGINETARRLEAMVEQFKALVPTALEPIAEDIKKYRAAELEERDE